MEHAIGGDSTPLWGSGATSFVIAGNGDVIILAGGNVYDDDAGNLMQIGPPGGGVTQIAVAGNGDVIILAGGTVYDGRIRNGDAYTTIQVSGVVDAIAVAGNGDLIMFQSSPGYVYDQWNPRNNNTRTLIGTSVNSFIIGSNGQVLMLEAAPKAMSQTTNPRQWHTNQVEQFVTQFRTAMAASSSFSSATCTRDRLAQPWRRRKPAVFPARSATTIRWTAAFARSRPTTMAGVRALQQQ